MHELFVTRSIHQIALKHARRNNVTKVLAVNLEVGALSDLQNEWLQKYFDRLSRGTVVEGAKLNIVRVSAVFFCSQCSQPFEIYSFYETDLTCKTCHSEEVRLISGREYRVLNMEVQ
jgi:hydrogenase nickel incorporation protein HypA/HybF